MKLLILAIVFLLTISNGESWAQGQAVRLVRVERDYLRDVDDGKECVPIEIGRKKGERLDLVLPHLYRTSASLWDEATYRQFSKSPGPYHPIQRTGGGAEEKGPELVFNLSKLKDGTYYVWLVGDAVGGTFQIRLKTE